ncbi:MAG: amidophosphoribosyltransferase [Oscillospiraceae bacterium]|nr:amidophosphoribosyltransferase [Oscillospiraceae bacterium]
MKTDKLNEECAVFGVSLRTDEAVGVTYNGLVALQHRGQEGAGIAVVKNQRIFCHKAPGLVTEVFSGELTHTLPQGRVAVGHARYSTTGDHRPENMGPFVTDYFTGRVATAHNGNITNAPELRKRLYESGVRFEGDSDSEVISSLIVHHTINNSNTVKGAIAAAGELRGAFSLVIATGKNRLIAVRDPSGFRPLCIGESEIGIAVASESCALESCGFKFVRDVQPGEVIIVEDGVVNSKGVLLTEKEAGCGLCIFEYVYFARADSIIDGLSVYDARRKAGAILAREHPIDADLVCGVPDSGLEAAYGYSRESGIPLASAFVKNRYIGRSFIYPTQSQRDAAVKLKLNPLAASVVGKRIVLIDDSIVRGTTSGKIIRNLKNAGAAQVHMRISSPPIRHVCHYGTDIDSEENLIINKMNIEEICRHIGADSLGYISLEGLRQACDGCSLSFCTNCFSKNQNIEGSNI